MDEVSYLEAILAGNGDLISGNISEKQISRVKLYLIEKRGNYESKELKQFFDVIFHNLINLSGTAKIRVLLNDTLSIWLLRAYQFNNANEEVFMIPEEQILQLFQYIVDFLDQNSTPLFNSINSLLIKLLNFVKFSDSKDKLIRCFIDRTSKLNSTSKKLYYLLEVLSKETDSNYIILNYPNVIDYFMQYIAYNPLANSVSKAFVTIYRGQYREGKDEEWLNTWFPIIKSGMENANSRQNILLYLLPLLFKVSHKSYSLFVKKLDIDLTNEESIDQFIHILNIGKNLLIIDPLNNDLIDKEVLESFLSHQNPKFRLNSFNLLANTIKSSTTIPENIYRIILNNNVIEIFMNEYENIEIRNEFVSSFKNFLLRIRDSAHASKRELLKLKQKNLNDERQAEICEIISSAYMFLGQVLGLCYKYLQIGSSYSQLYTSYKIIAEIILIHLEDIEEFSNSQNISDFSKLISQDLVNTLILNTMSNYQDIREINSHIIWKLPSKYVRSVIRVREDELKSRAIEILSDLKGRNSEGGAKMIELLILYYLKIEKSEEMAINLFVDLVTLLNRRPSIRLNNEVIIHNDERSHGLLTALNLCLQVIPELSVSSNWNVFNENILIIVEKISLLWIDTKGVLSNEMYDDQEETDVQKLLSSYCWRVVKESSTLVGTILKIQQKNNQLTEELLLKSSDLIIEQLANVSHRGAFSSVYTAFLLICQICFQNKNFKSLPKAWLVSNIQLIESKSQFISRRSGGLPFLITAILSADLKVKDKSHELMSLAFGELLRIARLPYVHKMDEKRDIPQVHAFNCIKQIFSDSILSSEALVYLNSSLVLAFENFNSANWSIRNCAVMLFTSLQQKLFGNKMIGENYIKMSPKLFFNKYPGIDTVLLSKLNESLSSKGDVETIFPALTILTRVEAHEEEDTLKEFKILLNKYLDSNDWKVREMASFALSYIIEPEQVENYCSLLIEDSKSLSLNKMHGNLMTILGLLNRMKNSNLTSNLKKLLFDASNIFLTNSRSFNWATSKVYIDILNIISNENCLQLPTFLINILGNFLVQNIINSDRFLTLNGARQLMLSSVFSLLANEYLKSENHDTLEDLISLCINERSLYELQVTALDFSINKFDIISLSDNFGIIANELIRDDKNWVIIKVKSLHLLSLILKKSKSFSDLDLEYYFHLSYQPIEEVRMKALECLGCSISGEDKIVIERFLNSCQANYGDNLSFDSRYSSVNAIVSYLNSASERDSYFTKACFLLHEALNDEDEDIRKLSAKCLSEVLQLRIAANPTAVDKSFYQYFSKLIPAPLSQPYIIEKFKKMNEFAELIKYLEFLGSNSLLDYERTNLFKNQIEMIRTTNDMLLLSNEEYPFNKVVFDDVKPQILENIDTINKYITINGKDGLVGWTRQEYYFVMFVSTILSTKTLLRIYNDEELLSKYDLLCQLVKDFEVSPIICLYISI